MDDLLHESSSLRKLGDPRYLEILSKELLDRPFDPDSIVTALDTAQSRAIELASGARAMGQADTDAALELIRVPYL